MERREGKMWGTDRRAIYQAGEPSFLFPLLFPLRSWIFNSKPPEFVRGEFLSKVQPEISLLGKKQKLKKKS